MIGCWSHALASGPDAGHLVKSRAAVNEILYNRITQDTAGRRAGQLDLPNGGESYVIGNLLQQGSSPKNKQMLAYLEEGANPANPDHHLYVVNNTFVNDAGSGTLVYLGNGSQATVEDNLFIGGGTCHGRPADPRRQPPDERADARRPCRLRLPPPRRLPGHRRRGSTRGRASTATR